MQWEALTEPDFRKAVKKSEGVCLLAIGCLEKHGPHLPLGTDYLNGHRLCVLAAEREPAIVFPPFYFSQIHEARHCAGTVAIDPLLTMQLLFNVCDEIGRNGCRKIIIHNAHGGNRHLIGYLLQSLLAQRKPYAVFWPERLTPERQKQRDALLTSKLHAHACECETSVSLANHPHLVKMDALKGRKTKPLGRLSHLPHGFTAIGWYADFPEHYAGDGNPATAEKGAKLRDLSVASLAEYVRAVKNDKITLRLQDEFYTGAETVGERL